MREREGENTRRGRLREHTTGTCSLSSGPLTYSKRKNTSTHQPIKSILLSVHNKQETALHNVWATCLKSSTTGKFTRFKEFSWHELRAPTEMKETKLCELHQNWRKINQIMTTVTNQPHTPLAQVNETPVVENSYLFWAWKYRGNKTYIDYFSRQNDVQVQPHQWKALAVTFWIIWLSISLSRKITKIGTTPKTAVAGVRFF